jgi:hypothetical protein
MSPILKFIIISSARVDFGCMQSVAKKYISPKFKLERSLQQFLGYIHKLLSWLQDMLLFGQH